MNKICIGIDNGVSGSIGVIFPDGETIFIKTPTKVQQNYTKKKGNITRIDSNELFDFLSQEKINESHCFCMIERPMVNPQRFVATTSALRSLEATLIVVEILDIPYQYIDSKEWQKELLPRGCKGDDLKKASYDIGIRLFPNHKELIEKQKDADGLLIAEYIRRKMI